MNPTPTSPPPPPAPSPEPHPALASVAHLIGVWEGEGAGEYPGIEPFRYRERIELAATPRPFLAYRQHTWHPESGQPMHVETGYLRVVPGSDRVELVVAQPTGLVEVDEGTVSDGVVTLASTTVAATATAKPVRSLHRRFWREGEELRYELAMGTDTVPESPHLTARLARVEG